MGYEEPKRFNPVEYAEFSKFVKKLDKEKGTSTAIGAIRAAIYFKYLTTEMQIELIRWVLEN